MAEDNTEQLENTAATTEEVTTPKPDRFDSLAATIRRTKETFSKEIADLKAQLETSKAAGTATPEDENDVHVQLKTYKKELDKLTRTLEKEKQQAQAEKDRNHLLGALGSAGVLSQKVLYNHLTSEGMIGRNDEGEMVFLSGGKNGVEKPLDEGLKEYLNTNEGKMFLPPSGASGSGATIKQPGLPQKQAGTTTKADRKAEAEKQLMAWASRIMPGRSE